MTEELKAWIDEKAALTHVRVLNGMLRLLSCPHVELSRDDDILLESARQCKQDILNAVRQARHVREEASRCPFCGTLDGLDYDSLDGDGGRAHRRAWCKRCGREWHDTYQLVGFMTFAEHDREEHDEYEPEDGYELLDVDWK